MNLRRSFLLLLVVATGLGHFEARGADGYALLGELNCTACHAASEQQAAWLSPKAAPRLLDIGNRASAEWVKRFLHTPQETLPGATMPAVLQQLPAAERGPAAEALTHFIFSPGSGNFQPVFPDRAAVGRGEKLYHRVGCAACHAPLNTENALPASAPLPRLAEKWSFDGMRRFLSDPLATRPSGRMPAMQLTDGEAADIAHYLLRETQVPAVLEVAQFRGRIQSLEELDSTELLRTGPATNFSLAFMGRDRGYALRFSGWLQIERRGEYTFHLTATGASRLSIADEWRLGQDSWQREQVAAKTTLRLDPGWYPLLLDYVQRGSKEPALKLEWEGPGISREVIPTSRLRSQREPVAAPVPFIVDAFKAEQGRRLYTELRCAVCHEATPPASPLPALATLQITRGCLAEEPTTSAVNFHLDASQRGALRTALAELSRADLAPPSPRQRVAHSMATFNCNACHAREGVGGVTPDRDAFFTSNGEDLGEEGRLPPRLDGVGDKLRPAWLDKVLAEGASVRPYLNTRMPQFGSNNVGHLTELFVALDRREQPLTTAPDAPEFQRDAGRRLIGTDGLSCIACHRFNRQPGHAFQVIDLTTAPERLNEDWFRRFLLDPNRFNPGTRMPAFWPDGVSPLRDVCDGVTDRQHAAIWTYLADGSRAKFPEGLSRQNMELVVGGEAVVYRGKLWEAGFRAVAVGFPGALNAAFDAEEMRLALLWRGRFLNAGAHWGVQGMGSIRPLGTELVSFPHGTAFAVLEDASAPWPSATSKALGMKFDGYQIDDLKRPTLRYSFQGVGVEDFLTPIEGNGKAGLQRTVKFTAPPPAGLHLRLAVGKFTPNGTNAWRLDDALTLRVIGGMRAFVRGEGDKQELLVPLPAQGAVNQLEVEYVW